TAVLVLLGDADHEAQVRAHQLLDRLLVARACATAQLDLLLRRDQLVLADLPEILIQCATLLGGTPDEAQRKLAGRPATSLPFLLLPCIRRGGHQTLRFTESRAPRFVQRGAPADHARNLPTKAPVGCLRADGRAPRISAASNTDLPCGVPPHGFSLSRQRSALAVESLPGFRGAPRCTPGRGRARVSRRPTGTPVRSRSSPAGCAWASSRPRTRRGASRGVEASARPRVRSPFGAPSPIPVAGPRRRGSSPPTRCAGSGPRSGRPSPGAAAATPRRSTTPGARRKAARSPGSGP